jgi:hypothetical protein
MKVFLSHSFGDEDGDLAQDVERLLRSHNILVVRGRRLAGGQLGAEVTSRIDDSHGLVALMTRRDRVGERSQNRWRTSSWIDDEYGYARNQRKPAIALVEDGVETGGLFEGYERIPLDRANPLEAFLALSETIRLWKEQKGFRRVAQLSPDSLSQWFRINGQARCRYRFVSREGVRGPWIDQGVEPIPQPRGALLYLAGIQDDDSQVEVEILQDERVQWWSDARPQYIGIELRTWEGAPP